MFPLRHSVGRRPSCNRYWDVPTTSLILARFCSRTYGYDLYPSRSGCLSSSYSRSQTWIEARSVSKSYTSRPASTTKTIQSLLLPCPSCPRAKSSYITLGFANPPQFQSGTTIGAARADESPCMPSPTSDWADWTDSRSVLVIRRSASTFGQQIFELVGSRSLELYGSRCDDIWYLSPEALIFFTAQLCVCPGNWKNVENNVTIETAALV